MHLRASFWKYQGNHDQGKDHPRKDPHGFGVDLISYMAWIVDYGSDYYKPLTPSDVSSIRLSFKKADGFGQEIAVSAPKEVWQKARESLLILKNLSH